MIGGSLFADEAIAEHAAGIVESEIVAVGNNRKKVALGAKNGLWCEIALRLDGDPQMDRAAFEFGLERPETFGRGLQDVA